jgi:hypothetical protein
MGDAGARDASYPAKDFSDLLDVVDVARLIFLEAIREGAGVSAATLLRVAGVNRAARRIVLELGASSAARAMMRDQTIRLDRSGSMRQRWGSMTTDAWGMWLGQVQKVHTRAIAAARLHRYPRLEFLLIRTFHLPNDLRHVPASVRRLGILASPTLRVDLTQHPEVGTLIVDVWNVDVVAPALVKLYIEVATCIPLPASIVALNLSTLSLRTRPIPLTPAWNLPNLTKLSIACAHLSVAAVRTIAGSPLRVLHLHRCVFRPDAFAELAPLATLDVLDIYGVGVAGGWPDYDVLLGMRVKSLHVDTSIGAHIDLYMPGIDPGTVTTARPARI